jgi:hypothetical protein
MIWNKKLMQSKRKPSPILGALAAIAVLALLLVIYMVSKPVPMAGTKSITIDVIYEDQTGESYQISTETQFLKEALDEIPEITIGGSTTEEFGLMLDTVNDVRADYQLDGAYWAILLDNEPCNYGVSMQPIKDGEHYTIAYTPAK